MKWYHWVGIAVVFAVVLLLWIFTGGRGPNPVEIAQREIDVVNAKAAVRRIEVELGATQAIAAVEKKYSADIAAMDEGRRKRALGLAVDPVKLTAFIVRGKTKTKT